MYDMSIDMGSVTIASADRLFGILYLVKSLYQVFADAENVMIGVEQTGVQLRAVRLPHVVPLPQMPLVCSQSC